jgi:hypothetical protein
VYANVVHNGMEEMTKIPGLQRRRNGWYLRVIIPQELASLFQKKEIIRSLKTTDYKVASKRVHAVRAGIEAEFEIKLKTAKLEAEHGDVLSPYGVDDSRSLCDSAIRANANYPKTVKISSITGFATKVHDNGNRTIIQQFSAKNAFGLEENFRARCVIDPKGGIDIYVN